MDMHVFISGGCKNGKSYYAQHIVKKLARDGSLYYVATMIPGDSEDEARIARHIHERAGWGFSTIECPRNIEKVLGQSDVEGAFLLDSVTALLANEMFCGTEVKHDAEMKVIEGLSKLLDAAKSVVLVSDFIYSDAGIYDELTEEYRRSLAHIDRFLAKRCECVIEVCGTNTYYHKGGEIEI